MVKGAEQPYCGNLNKDMTSPFHLLDVVLVHPGRQGGLGGPLVALIHLDAVIESSLGGRSPDQVGQRRQVPGRVVRAEETP